MENGTRVRAKIYECPYSDCDSRFNRPCRLAEHIQKHTGYRWLSCSFAECDKAFYRATHLNRHVRTAHLNDVRFPCTFVGCERRFSTQARLNRHVKLHSPGRFRCTDYPPCDELFRKQHTLSAHIRLIHQTLPPYTCDKCQRNYFSASRMKEHEASYHHKAFSPENGPARQS